ncbi:MAG TPA: DUF1415 family protein [Polyangiaceae bacterium]|nr:DUF1415 family protein [Polyangiaceae bacterium]
MDQHTKDNWNQQALRLYRRYQLEVVEAFDLCPWAKRARLDGTVREVVCLDLDACSDSVLGIIDEWLKLPELEIGLVLFPRLEIEREAFERFASRCLAADAARKPLASTEFVLAAFHPDGPLSLESPERLIPYLRRTPDPTLQFVRVSALERVRRGEANGTQFIDLSNLDLTTLDPRSWLPSSEPSLRERIASTNHRTVCSAPEAIARVLAELRRDREQTYTELRATPGEAPP